MPSRSYPVLSWSPGGAGAPRGCVWRHRRSTASGAELHYRRDPALNLTRRENHDKCRQGCARSTCPSRRPVLGGRGGLRDTSPSSGAIKVFVTPNGSGNGGPVVITGVISDAAVAHQRQCVGQAAEEGRLRHLLLLKKGTILVNGSQFNKATNAQPSSFQSTTCSGSRGHQLRPPHRQRDQSV